MELTNDFRVPIAPSEAWRVLTDLERIAPLLPGAELREVDGDEYHGVVKVKVGPITATYKGTARIVRLDESTGEVVISAAGRDTRGQGNASATITATMAPDGTATLVNLVTDLAITGKVAQFGRGVLSDVSTKLLGQFVEALEADLAAGATAGATTGATTGSTTGATTGATTGPATLESAEWGASAPASATREPAESASPGPRRIEGPEAAPVDLVALAGGSTLRRVAPPAGLALLLLLLFLGWRARRRRRG